jgi:hypothetical protein
MGATGIPAVPADWRQIAARQRRTQAGFDLMPLGRELQISMVWLDKKGAAARTVHDLLDASRLTQRHSIEEVLCQALP